MNEPRRRLLLPSLNPQGRSGGSNKDRPLAGPSPENADDNATQSSSSSESASTRRTGSRPAPTAAAAVAGEEHTSTSLSTTQSFKSERVLRYGETVDSLFCLHDGDCDATARRQRTLCEEICSGEKSGDAAAWREALAYTLGRGLARLEGMSDGHVGKRLINLHRRATSRFKLSNELETSTHDEVLKIWLLYAVVLLLYDTTSAAKDTYKHIQRLLFPNDSRKFTAALFSQTLFVADNDQNNNTEMENGVLLLKQSIRDGLTPVDAVETQIKGLERSGLLQSRINAPVRQIALPSLSRKLVPVITERESSVVDRQDGDCNRQSNSKNLASMQQTSSDKADEVTDAEGHEKESMNASHQRSKRSTENTSQRLIHSNAEGTNSFRAKLESRKKRRTDRIVALSTKTRKKEVSISAILSQTVIDEGDSDEDGDAAKKDQTAISDTALADNIDSKTTPDHVEGENWPEGGTIQTTAPDSDQARKHFKENISPIDEEGTASVKDLDLGYLLNWDPSKRESKKKVTIVDDRSRGEGKKSTAPKITRNDLGYMMNWEPFPKRQEGDSSCSSEAGSSKHASQSRLAQQNMSRIDEEATDASLTAGGDNGITAQSGSTCSSQGSRNSLRQQSRTSLETIASSKSHGESRDNAKSTTTSDLPQVEKSFLPLIEKNNIITVANQPYAKLGVIGKGGSCKVYRALSQDCDVVALKKVKLDGLNKAAIDGYANEIALLKRLKGNPAIIQLYSSEVDLERKSIYLVMELGEVDLNYVLRQQELMSSKQGRGTRSALNMNFIRLTWQQMLTAVHSIHEERIVHSDLKPANFLFVRGALKLIDFGIAKAIESQDTTNVYRETLSGTLSYMSPEAIMDTTTNSNGVRMNKCGRASDIWSLGCILYQMVYGKTPFADCHGIPQKVLAITNANHVIDFPDDVDEAAIDAMKLCLERNPKLRGTIVGKNGLLNEHIFLHSRTIR